MKSKISKISTLVSLILIHIFLLTKARMYITPELVFPVWLFSNAKIVVSEVQSTYPPILLYLISGVSNLTHNLLFSINFIQLTIVAIIDSLLFYYLNKKLNETLVLDIENDKLPNFFQKIDLFLTGPFGKTDKAKRVLPAKTIEALSIGVSTVVVKTPTTLRLLKNYNSNLIWVENNNASILADLIKNISNSQKKYKIENLRKHQFNNTSLNFQYFTERLSKIIS
jgi:hypothetical protein